MRDISSNISGYSLIQVSILISAMGVFLALALPFLEPLVVAQKYEQNAEAEGRMAIIADALSSHVERYGFLPCPASTLDPPDTIMYGRSGDCTNPSAPGLIRTNTGRDGRMVRIGAVPVRDLDIADENMQDAYGQDFVYAVTELLTDVATYSNDEGGIFVQDVANVDVTSVPGGALYTILSLGESGLGVCDFGRSEGENCDSDATFRQDEISLNPFSASYFDDTIIYSEIEPKSKHGLCGVKGKVYAPGHPDGDKNECIDITGYYHYQDMRLTDAQVLPCGVSSDFCNGPWLNVMSLNPGSYIINWDSYLTFNYPQPSQYALIEFEVDGVTETSQKIPFNGNVCDVASQLQYEKGVVNFEVDTTSQLRARIRLYGGDNNPAVNGCGGQTPQLNLTVEGQGDTAAQRSFAVTALRRFGGGGAGSTPAPVGGGASDVIATVNNLMGAGFVTHDDGSSEVLYNSLALFKGDKVTTDINSGVVIKFIDGTEFTLADNTEFEVGEYEYDVATGDGEAQYSIVRGVFLFVSGLIPKPKTEITTPRGSIGIRGTKILGGHNSFGSQLVLLEGAMSVYCPDGTGSGPAVDVDHPFHTVTLYKSCGMNRGEEDVSLMCDGVLELVQSTASKTYMLEALLDTLGLNTTVLGIPGGIGLVLNGINIDLPGSHCLLQP